MYDINKSMTENVRKYRDSVEDFKDFIEIWVHEIKLPIASLVLMCHNNRDVIPRKYEEQVARLDAYADQVLYYVRAEHAAADYRFAETNLKSVIGRVALKNKDMLKQQVRQRLQKLIICHVNTFYILSVRLYKEQLQKKTVNF